MPRAKAEAPKVVKKTTKTKRVPRKRAVRRTVPKKESKPKLSEENEIIKEIKPSTKEKLETKRKAPSQIPASPKSRNIPKKPVIVLVILLVAIGVSAFIGTSDSGQINIASVVEERNQKVASGEVDDENAPTESSVVPVQNTAPPSVPNAGLRGRGVGTSKIDQPPAVEGISTTTATSSATSTEASTATTTEDMSEENENEDAGDEVVTGEEDTSTNENSTENSEEVIEGDEEEVPSAETTEEETETEIDTEASVEP